MLLPVTFVLSWAALSSCASDGRDLTYRPEYAGLVDHEKVTEEEIEEQLAAESDVMLPFKAFRTEIENGHLVSIISPRAVLAPMDVIYVIDLSDSMNFHLSEDRRMKIDDTGRSRLDSLREIMQTQMAQLPDGTWLTLLSFNHETRLLLGRIQLNSESRKRVTYAISIMNAGGRTNIVGALERAIELFDQAVYTTPVNRFIWLLTDGEDVVKQNLERMNVPCTMEIFGLGPRTDTPRLMELATHFRHGSYIYMNDLSLMSSALLYASINAKLTLNQHAKLRLSTNSGRTEIPVGELLHQGVHDVFVHKSIGRPEVLILDDGTQLRLVDSPREVSDAAAFRLNLEEARDVIVRFCDTYAKYFPESLDGLTVLEGAFQKMKSRLENIQQQSDILASSITESALSQDWAVERFCDDSEKRKKYLPDLIKDLVQIELSIKLSIEFETQRQCGEKINAPVWAKHFLATQYYVHLDRRRRNRYDPGGKCYESDIAADMGALAQMELQIAAAKIILQMDKEIAETGHTELKKPTAQATTAAVGVCVTGGTRVTTPEGTIRMDEIVPGQTKVLSRNGEETTVECMTYHLHPVSEIVSIGSKSGGVVEITLWHPVNVGDGWVFPKNIQSHPMANPDGKDKVMVYSFLTANRQPLYLDNISIATLAQANPDDLEILAHPFYSSETGVVKFLKLTKGYKKDGRIHIDSKVDRDDQGRVSMLSEAT